MAVFLLRDDDANATTDPGRLEQVYAPLLDARHHLVFSVIPRVALDTKAPDGTSERFVREDLAGSPDSVPLRASSPLACWLRTNRARCDVAQHGLDHRRVRGGTEFGALSYREALDRIDAGHRQLSDALGHAPLGFVAPWDALSRGSLAAAVERFPVVSTSWVDRDRLSPLWWPAHVVERARRSESLRLGTARVLRHRGGPIGPDTRPEDVPAILARLAQNAEVAVVVLHHWMFWSRSGPHPVVTALARALRGHHTASLAELVPRSSHHGTSRLSPRDSLPASP